MATPSQSSKKTFEEFALQFQNYKFVFSIVVSLPRGDNLDEFGNAVAAKMEGRNLPFCYQREDSEYELDTNKMILNFGLDDEAQLETIITCVRELPLHKMEQVQAQCRVYLNSNKKNVKPIRFLNRKTDPRDSYTKDNIADSLDSLNKSLKEEKDKDSPVTLEHRALKAAKEQREYNLNLKSKSFLGAAGAFAGMGIAFSLLTFGATAIFFGIVACICACVGLYYENVDRNEEFIINTPKPTASTHSDVAGPAEDGSKQEAHNDLNTHNKVLKATESGLRRNNSDSILHADEDRFINAKRISRLWDRDKVQWEDEDPKDSLEAQGEHGHIRHNSSSF